MMRSLLVFFITFVFYGRLLAKTRSGLMLTIEPESPQPDEMVKLQCGVVAEIVNFHFMTVKFNNKVVTIVKYELRAAEKVGEWKSRNSDIKYDPEKKMVTLLFRARRNDTGKVECRVQISTYPDEEKDRIAERTFLVQQKPKILSLRLQRKIQGKWRDTTTFEENEKMTVICTIDLGWPMASIKLTRFGPPDSGTLTSNHDKKYGYNQTTQSIVVTVTSRENGEAVRCVAQNTLGPSIMMKTINVLYGVRDLRFRYHNGQQMQVGTSVSCAARGNPMPMVNLTVVPIGNATHRVDGSPPRWTLNSSLARGETKKQIPEDAPVGTYGIMCTAKNEVRSKKYMRKSEFVRINVTGIKTAGMGLILGVTIPTAIFFLLILFCCCRSYRRKKKDRRAEEDILSYQPKLIQVSDGRRRPHYREEMHTEPGISQANEQLLSAGRDRKEDGINSSNLHHFDLFDESCKFILPPRAGPSSSGMGSSYKREEDPECPTTPLTNYSTPRKPPRSITSSSSRGLSHWPNSMDSRDAYSPADGASVPFTDDAIVHDVNSTSKAHEGEAEEEFV